MSFLNTLYEIDFIIIAISIIIRAKYLFVYSIILYVAICKIQDKSRPVLIWYGTYNFTFKYGTIL